MSKIKLLKRIELPILEPAKDFAELYEYAISTMDYGIGTNGERGLFWVRTKGQAKRGHRVGTMDPNGYRWLSSKNKFEHQFVFLLHHGYIPKRPLTIDHIDQCKTNNDIGNLRIASQSQQNANRKSNIGTSRHRGVAYCSKYKKWLAQYITCINHERKTYFIGYFPTEDIAGYAYNAFVRVHPDYDPKFQHLNDINETKLTADQREYIDQLICKKHAHFFENSKIKKIDNRDVLCVT